MSVESVSAAVVEPNGGGAKTPGNYGFSRQDVSRFENAFADASATVSKRTVGRVDDTAALQALISPLSNLNAHSEKLKAEAESAIGENLKPSELMMLTMHTHQFMFHCQLTANVANRSSDGVQQLFRQQS